MGVYNFLNIGPATVMKNSETLGFVPDHLKTKKVCKHAVKRTSLSIKIYSWSI